MALFLACRTMGSAPTFASLTCSSTLYIRPFYVANDGLPTVVHVDVLDANKLLPAIRRRRRTSTCVANALSKRAAADPNAAIRRSVPNPLSSLARTAMVNRVEHAHQRWVNP